jgi:hypothetical protein
MGKKIKLTNLRTGEVLVVDEEDYVGPVKIHKPKGKYITPDKLPKGKSFSKVDDSLLMSEAEKEKDADELIKYFKEHGIDD